MDVPGGFKKKLNIGIFDGAGESIFNILQNWLTFLFYKH